MAGSGFYEKLGERAAALGASQAQLQQIEEWGESVGAISKRRMLIKGDDPGLRDLSLRTALETWLSALATNHHPNEYWRAACSKSPTN